MDIHKQIDSSDLPRVSDALVGFVEAQDANVGGHTVSRYSGAIYRRPLTADPRAIATCGHEHRDPDAAARCVRRLLRIETAFLAHQAADPFCTCNDCIAAHAAQTEGA